jgi:hypothetical protein
MMCDDRNAFRIISRFRDAGRRRRTYVESVSANTAHAMDQEDYGFDYGLDWPSCRASFLTLFPDDDAEEGGAGELSQVSSGGRSVPADLENDYYLAKGKTAWRRSI